MRSYSLFTVLVSLVSISQPAIAKLEAHEWGTFTSLVGSNGKTQGGMYHEDEKLPDFVHAFGYVAQTEKISSFPAPDPQPDPQPAPKPKPCNGKVCFAQDFFATNTISQKMETPVIYFYTDKYQDVEVNVRFPNGIITDTYPAPIASSPKLSNNPALKNGSAKFAVTIVPDENDTFPIVPSGNIYEHARKVASNVVQSKGLALTGNRFETEKFIFYRGIGTFQPKISITSSNNHLSLTSTSASLPQAAFLIHVNENGHSQMIDVSRFNYNTTVTGGYSQTISSRQIKRLKDHYGSPISGEVLPSSTAKVALINALDKSGLNLDEAIAMVNTWEHGYLKVPGLRLLYILPRAEADEILPLTITPRPDNLERVFVGRIEVMLDLEEQELLNRILQNHTTFEVASLGRFAESKLLRVRELYQEQQNPDPKFLQIINNLLAIAQSLFPQ